MEREPVEKLEEDLLARKERRVAISFAFLVMCLGLTWMAWRYAWVKSALVLALCAGLNLGIAFLRIEIYLRSLESVTRAERERADEKRRKMGIE